MRARLGLRARFPGAGGQVLDLDLSLHCSRAPRLRAPRRAPTDGSMAGRARQGLPIPPPPSAPPRPTKWQSIKLFVSVWKENIMISAAFGLILFSPTIANWWENYRCVATPSADPSSSFPPFFSHHLELLSSFMDFNIVCGAHIRIGLRATGAPPWAPRSNYTAPNIAIRSSLC